MNRNMIIFIAIAVPVVVCLIVAVVVITLSINTVRDGKMCVPLNSDNETVNDKVYFEGTHLISPAYHFSEGLPVKEAPMAAGVEVQSTRIPNPGGDPTELGIFIVFKFYIKEENAYKYFDSLAKRYSAEEYDIMNGFIQKASSVVEEVLSRNTCAQYDEGKDDEAAHEKKWIDYFARECNISFVKNNSLFTLYEPEPIRAIFFFEGCQFD